MSRLNKALPLLRLDYVEGFGRDGLEEHNLSRIPVHRKRLRAQACSYNLLSELEETEVELVPSQHTD